MEIKKEKTHKTHKKGKRKNTCKKENCNALNAKHGSKA